MAANVGASKMGDEVVIPSNNVVLNTTNHITAAWNNLVNAIVDLHRGSTVGYVALLVALGIGTFVLGFMIYTMYMQKYRATQAPKFTVQNDKLVNVILVSLVIALCVFILVDAAAITSMLRK
ncbi:hypothetical protein NEFER03_0362 [Nematocida sp. LUAm3]|nr:hypothetical protein NEFER03_0362 [Nematocida sp. LUAm3]KAI5176022.1 hypothetical protein NEFER02_1868 [Nematocida sp. LUAm2]KAI5179119.1 hypothetical protein NEFER01_1986 [Nematocida sp. LUAm1]